MEKTEKIFTELKQCSMSYLSGGWPRYSKIFMDQLIQRKRNYFDDKTCFWQTVSDGSKIDSIALLIVMKQEKVEKMQNGIILKNTKVKITFVIWNKVDQNSKI